MEIHVSFVWDRKVRYRTIRMRGRAVWHALTRAVTVFRSDDSVLDRVLEPTSASLLEGREERAGRVLMVRVITC